MMAFAILAVSSCTVTFEEENPEFNDNRPVYYLKADISNPDTKTSYLEDDVNKKAIMSWVSGDIFRMVVYETTTGDPGHYSCTASESGASANFTFGGDLGTHTRSGYAVYPELTIGGTQDDYTVTLPAEYTISSGTDLSKVKVPMIGTVDPMDDDHYIFQAAVGVLKVTLTNVPVEARKLVLTTASDNLSGVFPLDAGNGFRMSDVTGEAGHTVTVNFPQQAAGSTISVYVPVPVGSISAGATLSIQQSNGTAIKTTGATTRAISIVKGHLTPLPAISVEDWITLGEGKYMDDHGFYYLGTGGRTAGDYATVTIQKHAESAGRYRIASPYASCPYADTYLPDAADYLYIDVEDGDIVANHSYRFNNSANIMFDGPYWGYDNLYHNSRIINRDGEGNPLNIQLAPYYYNFIGDYTQANCAQNPKIEVVFPGGTPMLAEVFNYPASASASYSAGNVTASFGGNATITGIKVKAATGASEAAAINAGINALLAGEEDLSFNASDTKALALADGSYYLVYMVETSGHGFTFKKGGSFTVYSKPEIALDNSMITVNVDAGTKDGSSHYDGAGKGALVDGNTSTFWHTPWESHDATYYNWSDLDATYGAYIDIDLGEGYSVSDFDIRVCMRSAGSDWPKHVIVYSKPDGGVWSKVGEVANVFTASGQWSNTIQCSGVDARFIRFSIVSNTSDMDLTDPSDAGCTHLAEIKLYGTVSHNGVPVDPWLNIFTDSSYSELKTGVTSSEISAMNGIAPYYLAENVALPLLNSTYQDKEFRIGSYAPYSDIRMDPPVFMTRLYSAMDNPTGIEVKNGEEITVCVDRIPDGQTVSLAIYGDEGTNPNFGGTADWTYGYTGSWQEGYDQNVILTAGINTINITADGMAYVMNTVTQADPYNPSKTSLASYQAVKVHFLPGSGTVQGYFEPAKQENAFGQSYIDACTYKYFMIKGEKASFLLHTDEVQKYTAAEIRSGIEAMDSAVVWEQELCGIDNLSWFNNHILFCSQTSGTYMDASHRRVMLSTDNISKIISLDGIMSETGEGGWGPFHEMGHIHQHPINWKSTSESSNNLFSNYCKKMLADQEGATFYSRGKPLSILAQNLAAKTPWVLLGLTPSGDDSYQNEDTEIHMRMNWQLWNYYHNCGYNTHFFPDLFTYLRKTENMLYSEYSSWYYWNLGFTDTPGKAQLQYYEACCEVAQEDLTEFFEVWGFFRPVDIQYSQYGNAQYTVTQSMIDDAKARVAAKGYPKAAPIQYLEDRAVAPYGDNDSYIYSQLGLWTQFRDNPVITGTPTANMNGNMAFLSGVDNAVGIEYRKGDNSNGELLNFSNMQYIEIPAVAGTLWAVQSDGTRVQIM